MKIFISWSKQPSRQVAEALADWLPDVIQSLDPWVSKEIPAGSRWNTDIANELASTKFGIICVTRANQHEPWLQFEAGALAKTLDEQTHVCPYLIDMSEGELNGPLVAFQSVRANEEGTRKLVQDINSAMAVSGGPKLSDVQLKKAFDRNWHELKTKLDTLVEQSNVSTTKVPSIEEMVAEILAISRETNRQLNATNDDSDNFYTGSVKRTIRLSKADNTVRTNTFSVEGNEDKIVTFKETLESIAFPPIHLMFEADETTKLVCFAKSRSENDVALRQIEKVAKEIATILELTFLPF